MEIISSLKWMNGRMEEIIAGVMKKDGIEVAWQKGDRIVGNFFTYEELIAMKINAADLLEHPNNYLLDVDRHLIVFRH